MSRSHAVVTLVIAAGCNAAFSLAPTEGVDPDLADAGPPPPDRDRDGIFDFEDACIVGVAEAAGDHDGDGAANAVDPCPLELETSHADTDGDAIADACDPEPSSPDEVRCLHLFLNPSINVELWTPRAGDESAWTLYETGGLYVRGGGTIVAGESFEGPQVTQYDARFTVIPSAASASVTLWLRTNVAPASTDLGCELSGTATQTQLSIIGASGAPSQAQVAFGGGYGLRATVVRDASGGTNVRCRVALTSGAALQSTATAVLPAGTVGLAASGADVNYQGLMVYERAANPL
ncbi:MAG: hypothetical protein M3680_08745 [Myxococcota bacterium]|nr:hypothetical protein [Myxococcota bacterium]